MQSCGDFIHRFALYSYESESSIPYEGRGNAAQFNPKYGGGEIRT